MGRKCRVSLIHVRLSVPFRAKSMIMRSSTNNVVRYSVATFISVLMPYATDVIADELLRPETNVAAADATGLTESRQRERERFDALANVLVDASTRAADLSESQRRETSLILQDSIKSTLAKRTEFGAAGRPSVGTWPDLAPVYFTSFVGPAQNLEAASLSIASIEGLLSEDQRRCLNGVLEDRIQFRRQAALNYILHLLDNELFLTGDQKAKLTQIIKETVDPDAACFALKPGVNIQLRLAEVLPDAVLCSFLTDLQQQRLSDLTHEAAGIMPRGGFGGEPSARPGFVRLQTIDSRQKWSLQIRSTFADQKDRLLRTMELQTVFCQTEGPLNQAQVNHLRVAAKGVIEEVLPAWESRLLERMQEFQEVAAGCESSASHNCRPRDTLRLRHSGQTDQRAGRHHTRHHDRCHSGHSVTSDTRTIQ